MELDHLWPRGGTRQPEPGSPQRHRLGFAPRAAASGPEAPRVYPGEDAGSQGCSVAAVEGQPPGWVCLRQDAASWHRGVPLAHQLPGSGPHMSCCRQVSETPGQALGESALDAGVPWRWDAVGLLLLQNVPSHLAFRRHFWGRGKLPPSRWSQRLPALWLLEIKMQSGEIGVAKCCWGWGWEGKYSEYLSWAYLQEEPGLRWPHILDPLQKLRKWSDVFVLVKFSNFFHSSRESHVSSRKCSFPEMNRGWKNQSLSFS